MPPIERVVSDEPSVYSPPLMIFPPRALSAEEAVYITNMVERARLSPLSIVFEPGFEVFQLVGGRWQPVVRTENAPAG